MNPTMQQVISFLEDEGLGPIKVGNDDPTCWKLKINDPWTSDSKFRCGIASIQPTWSSEPVVMFNTYKSSLLYGDEYKGLIWKFVMMIKEMSSINEAKIYFMSRYMLNSENIAQAFINSKRQDKIDTIKKSKDATGNIFLDKYILDFLDVPSSFSERDLRKSIIENLKSFILEIGKDFTFIGEEYRIQVGMHDYYIDLLFYHRGLSCLAAFELKVGEFKPEYVGKMNVYLEALDREIKKENENPTVGIILCASKDDEIVEYALSRNLSPTMISEYSLKLINKKLLQKKLKEYIKLVNNISDDDIN